jgi:hypothetical protein
MGTSSSAATTAFVSGMLVAIACSIAGSAPPVIRSTRNAKLAGRPGHHPGVAHTTGQCGGSRTSRTLRASLLGVKDFCRNGVPGSRMPSWMMTLSV